MVDHHDDAQPAEPAPKESGINRAARSALDVIKLILYLIVAAGLVAVMGWWKYCGNINYNFC